jgi:hypothetical protein
MPTPTAYLLVEGQNDQHVVWALCEQHQLAKTFSVLTPDDKKKQGIEAILEGLPLRLKVEGLHTLGILVDANHDLAARWQAVRHQLSASGYKNIPRTPPPSGLIITPAGLPRVGIWLMPNNQVPGMLEDFVAELIPTDDSLRPKAESALQDIETSQLNRYTIAHRPKALIHTWLAWQETPGMPMGQAITAQALQYNSPLARRFIEWLKLLFELP